jgi:exopolysaccharide biosynthesis operon protein EpsL
MAMQRILKAGVASLALSACPTWALWNDTVEVKAATGLRYDDNLFRLPANADVAALTGRSDAKEEILVSSVGLGINKSYSLQRFEADFSVVDYRYRNFDVLDFTANNYSAAWHWSLTPDFHGTLGTERRESQNSYADVQNIRQSNQRTAVDTRFDGEYNLDGAWSVLGGLNRASLHNEEAVVGEDDTRTTSVLAGVRRSFASGSAVSYTLKSTEGRYLNRTPSAASLLDDEFRQIDHGLRLAWAFTGKSTANFSLTHMDRTHAHFAQRDFSGWTSSANVKWAATDKVSLVVGYAELLAGYQTRNTNYTRTRRLSLTPTWQVSAKTALRLRHEVAQIDFRGAPDGVAPSDRSDTTNDTSLSIQWQPTRPMTLSASLLNSRRTSSGNGLDFRSKQATLGAQFSF